MDIQDLKNEKTVFIIDGSSFLYRAYYAIQPITTSQGVPVNAVFGFCRMIKKLIDKYKPQHCILVWDSRGKTMRSESYEAYKATRQAAPLDLHHQKDIIHEFAQAIGLREVEKQGYEADDLMYALAKDLSEQGYFAVLVTTDKDLGQVVGDSVVLYDAFKDEFLDRIVLETKYGFPLEKLVFYFALIGDTSDNIPGVAGIGPKTAQQLVMQFASLEELYNNLDNVPKERTRLLLQTGRDNAFLSEKLFTLHYYHLGLTIEDIAFSVDQWPQARAFFEKLEFKSLLKELSGAGDTATGTAATQAQQEPLSVACGYSFVGITTQAELEQLCADIIEAGECAVDTETDTVHALQAQLVGMSFCYKKGTAYYLPFAHATIEQQLYFDEALPLLKTVLENPAIKKYLHNSKFDQLVLHAAGIELQGVVCDTMVAASLVVQTGISPDVQRVGLKYLSEKYLNEQMQTFADVVTKKGFKNFTQVPLNQAIEYGAADAHQTWQLVPLLLADLKTHDQLQLFNDIEMPLVQILYGMECEGILCDKQVLDSYDIEVTRALAQIRELIVDLIGQNFADINLNSPKQLEKLLFEELKLTPVKKTSQKSSYSTDQEVLEQLALVHPVPKLIIKYRELSKLKGTYIDGLREVIDPHERIHTTFSQVSVATGRLASFDPNLQNVPVGERILENMPSVHIRAAFKAPQGHQFVSVDYSQMELRILAYFSQDKRLIQAFVDGEDIHALTAAGIFDVPLAAVTHEQRQIGKRINFSILYGLTPYGLSKDLKISYADAERYIEKYFAQYPQVLSWMESVVEETKGHGYVTTYWGRRRYIPGIYEKNRSLFDLARRIAINTKAQGTAAELVKKGMLLADAALKREGLHGKMLLQIHDELLFAVPDTEVERTVLIIEKELSSVVDWNVPLQVTTRIGKDWHEVSK